jgi:threonine/homoserine/homoserine lactone efflux protein
MLALKAFLFGVTVAAAVGPIALLIVNIGLRSGPGPGLRAALGAALADLIYAITALTAGGAAMTLLSGREAVLRVAASVIVIALGVWMAWRAAREDASKEADAPRVGRPLVGTFVLTAVNPLTILVFVGFLPHLPADPAPGEVALASASLFAGSLFIQTVFALGGVGLGRVLGDPRWIRRLNIASGLGIVAFGVAGLL